MFAVSGIIYVMEEKVLNSSPPAITINDILASLQAIIAEGARENDRAAYFAALYYKVTAGVKDGIIKGRFENGPRMERFDVIFASRYLDALKAWRKGGECSGSWKIAFESTKKSSLLVLQQLLLGMNAHINLDLGIAAVEASDGQLAAIQNDFDTINTIISSLTYQVLNEIDQVSPLLSLLGLHADNQTSVLIQFSIDNARDGAWCFAEDLATKTGDNINVCIAQRDQTITKLAGGLIYNKGVIRFTLWLIHLFEWSNPAKIIKVLYGSVKQKIVVANLKTL